jgi:hypothetical protein
MALERADASREPCGSRPQDATRDDAPRATRRRTPYTEAMKRVHVPEVEDMSWFPSRIREGMTNLIVVFARKFGVVPVLGALTSRALNQSRLDRIVDLGSGSGGSMPEVIEAVRKDPATSHVELAMTDKFPNQGAIARFDDPSRPHVRYARESVDATDLATAPAGLKTMVNCFHHMRPPQARKILESAQRSRQPILIYEMADNAIPFGVWLAFLPLGLVIVFLMALLLTFSVRPMTLTQLAFTFVIPLIPLFYAWDGQASLPRIYTLGDLDELTGPLSSTDYTWEKGYALTDDGKKKGIYLLGMPA